jgi:hypothetical protein
MTLTPESPKPIVESPGFTLIEDDDVAFTVSLCREIHRIYGDYQAGALEATDSVRAGLNLTMQTFAALQNTVIDGMPALRLEVGAAQAREMMAALFGEGLPYRRSRGVPARNRICGRGYTPSYTGRSGHQVASGPTAEVEPVVVNELVEQNPTEAIVEPLASATWPEQTAVEAAASVARSSRSRRVFRTVLMTLAGLIAICLAAVLINVPFAILALYPNHFVPLSLAFVGFALVAGLASRIIRSRRSLSA